MHLHSRVQTGLFWAGIAAFAAGFLVERLWRNLPDASAALLWALGLVGWGVGHLVARRLRWRVATSVGLVWLTCQAGFGGMGPVFAVLLLAGAAAALGSLLVGREWTARLPLSILVGLALILGVDGWLLPLPLHRRTFYLAAFGLVLVWRRRVLVEMVRETAAGWRSAVEGAPRAALFAVACTGAVSTCAWFPAIFYDAMAYHLALPVQLARFGYYQMNVATNVWALAPWASDVAQGIAWVLAGEEANGSVGLLWLIPALALVWSMLRLLNVSAMLSWMGVALYVSMPFVVGLLTTMQAELPTAAVLAAMAVVVLQQGHAPTRGMLAVIGALTALLLALKVSNVLFILPLLAWLLWCCRGRLPWKVVPLVAAGAVLLAASSYVYAYLLAGNPVLPVFNALFKSAYYPPVNFHDARWDHALGWFPPWALVFHSSMFVEARDGVGPIVLVALAGSWACALARRHSRGLALVGAACLVLPLTQVHYLRYVMPAMVVLVPAMLAGLPASSFGTSRAQAAALVVLAWLSALFVPGANWQTAGSGLATLIKKGREGVLERYAPERLAANFVLARRQAGDRILLVDEARPFTAMFGGTAFTSAWYDPQLSSDRRREGLAGVIASSGANLLLVPRSDVAGIAALLQQRHAAVVFSAGDIALWQLRDKTGTPIDPPRPSPSNHAGMGAPSGPDLAAQRDMAMRIWGAAQAATVWAAR